LARAALQVADRHGPDALMLVMPADHLISDEALFGTTVGQAAALAAQGYLVTFGIQPTAPETGYGYIEAGEPIPGTGHQASDGRHVVRFIEKPAREKAELTRALGLESDGKIPAALRAQIRQLEEDQKRRAKRARTDVLDRAMIDLLSFYRDVLTTQMGSDVERVTLDLSDAVDQAARTTSPEQSLARIAAIEECRSRLRSNAAPLLAVEALMVQLRPQAEGR